SAAATPFVIGAGADLHHPTQKGHRVINLLVLDEAIFHFISFAKKALAFFRISFSNRSSLFSLRKRINSARSSLFSRSPPVSASRSTFQRRTLVSVVPTA